MQRDRRCGGDNPHVPLPFVPPSPRPGVSLGQHVSDKNDPHETLKQAKQVRIVPFMPAHPEEYNDGDLVVVTTAGKLYRASVSDGAGTLEEIPLAAPATDFLDGMTFDLSSEDKIVAALGTVIEKLGGTPYV